MNDWLEELASALEVEPLAREETGAVLKLARDVAHGVERKFAPLSTYLLGVAVGSRTTAGSERAEAFRHALDRAQPRVPPPEEEVGASRDPPDG
jgi:uncharacterized protein DUF6457